MPGYPDLNEMDDLWQENGFAIIVEDEMKPTDIEGFVTMLDQFNDPNFELPPSKTRYSYWVHDADGNTYNCED